MDFSEYTLRQDSRLEDLPIQYAFVEPLSPQSAVILMPAARTKAQTDRTRAYFPRWSWAEKWPQSLVITVADPVLTAFPRLDGGWFVHPEHDVIHAIAAIVEELITERGIPPQKATFYGSSLGGYGAIGAATELRGSNAIAEVPQIDVEAWMPRFVLEIEEYVLRAMSLKELRQRYPERLNLTDRARRAEYVPPIHLITNAGDYSIRDQRRFIQWCADSGLPKMGKQTLEEVVHLDGHKVLTQDELIARLIP